MNKKYELVQDIKQPNDHNYKAGEIFTKKNKDENSAYLSSDERRAFHPCIVENNPTWFKEIVSEPKIEVHPIQPHDNFKGNGADTYWYQFSCNKNLGAYQLEQIRYNAEKTLNTSTPTSELVEDKKELSAIDTLRMNEEGVNVFNHDTINKRLDRIHYLQALGCDLISRIYHYGNFKAETMTERVLEKVLIELQLFPTTEDEILKRPPLPNSIEPTTTNDKEVKKEPFVWTDELAFEFANHWIRDRKTKHEALDEFKSIH